jgi:hypothetical protein
VRGTDEKRRYKRGVRSHPAPGSLAYKRPVVDGLKSVFSGFKKLYGLKNGKGTGELIRDERMASPA